MKSLSLILLTIVFSCIITQAQQPAKAFYQQHKRLKGVQNFKLPGWLMWIGTGIANEIVKDDGVRAVLKLGRKVKKMRLLMTEGNNPISTADVQNFVSESYQNGYEDLIFVREDGTTVNILGKIKKDKFRNLTILVNEEQDFFFFDMKSNIKVKDISKLIHLAMKKTPLKKEEKSKRKKDSNTPKV